MGRALAIVVVVLGAGGCRDLSVMEVVSDLGTGSGSGTIALTQRAVSPSGGFITDATASLVRQTMLAPTETCTMQTLAGGCTATTCTPITDVPPTVVDPVDAGIITIGGGAMALSFTPSPDDSTYSPSGSPLDLWQGGEMLVASAPGNLAPAFSVALTAPDVVSVTAPSGAVTLAGGQDLVLSTASTDMMSVGFGYVDSTVSPAATVTVSCQLQAGAGSVTFPAAALAAAPAGQRVTVSATTTAASTATVGGWTIAFTATSNAAFPGGNNGISVTVQ